MAIDLNVNIATLRAQRKLTEVTTDIKLGSDEIRRDCVRTCELLLAEKLLMQVAINKFHREAKKALHRDVSLKELCCLLQEVAAQADKVCKTARPSAFQPEEISRQAAELTRQFLNVPGSEPKAAVDRTRLALGLLG